MKMWKFVSSTLIMSSTDRFFFCTVTFASAMQFFSFNTYYISIMHCEKKAGMAITAQWYFCPEQRPERF